MDFFDVLKKRRSIRKFTSFVIPDEDIETILNSAHLAPTARNIQPWEFIVVKDRATKSSIARLASKNGSFLDQAPVCIAIFCQDTKYYLEDGSAATTSALLAAVALGYGACWVAGDKKEYAEEVRLLLGVSSGFKLVSLIALGKPGEEPNPQKRSVKEVLHKERF